MSDSVWILLAGDADKAHGRNFAPFFCRYGLAAMGPGQHGPYGAAPERYAGPVQRFVGMPAGALIALSLGKTVTAVGEVTEAPYQYEMGLGYADARDLRHVRRVAWRRIEPLSLAEARRSPLSVVGGAEAQRLRAAWEAGRPASSGTEYLPDFTGIGDQGVLSNLAGRGAPFDRLDAVAAGLVRARRLAAWNQSTAVSSAEVRTLLVVPFLEALGWSPLSIRLDWRRKRRGKQEGPRLEMALLERPDRTGSAPRAVLVVSRPGAGLQQMLRHAEKTVGDGAGARLLVATDGRMWQVRIRDAQGWAPWATLDLVWPTARFHFDADASDIPGATEAIEALSPWAALPRPQKEVSAPALPPEVVAHLQGESASAPAEGTGKKRRRRRRRKRGGEGTAAPQGVAPEQATEASKTEAAPAPKAEAAPAPKAEAAPAPKADPAPALKADPAPAPKADPAPAPKAEAAPAPKADSAPAPKADPAPAPKAEAAPAPKTEAAPAPKADPAPAPKADPTPAPSATPTSES